MGATSRTRGNAWPICVLRSGATLIGFPKFISCVIHNSITAAVDNAGIAEFLDVSQLLSYKLVDEGSP
jgi:hypothetical protein